MILCENPETVWLLSEDTKVETQRNNIKLEPILYEKVKLKKCFTKFHESIY